ncbi:MAG TPA: hypothetical protein VMW56_15460 [Candidatus Margulisiibacteriota bacterium]|nr:hypothetical protein [Candidatus Margulisiibacteriota bacterium]
MCRMISRCLRALVTILLVSIVALPLVAEARASTPTGAGRHVLSGELVVTDAAKNRFRIVGHGGSFTAPAGTPVAALDGKPVAVEFTGGGRVLQISELPIHFEPITRSYEIISGQLVLNDAAMRTFAIAGDSRVYRAPAGTDIAPYAGRRVEVRVDEQGRVMDVSPTARTAGSPSASTCSYDGQGYSDGASLCQSGTQYRCARGTWRSLGSACVADGATLSRWLRTCQLGDATVASGSLVCRSGTTFRCADGEWLNVGTACS